MEPDHSGSIKEVLEANRYKAIVIGHPLTKMMLKSFYGIEPRFRIVRDGEVLDIGDKKLMFIHTPWLHWPETIMTYLEDYGVLLSCDAFGGYSIPSTIFDDNREVVKSYMPYVKKYIANIIGYYRNHILRNIEKIKKLGLNIKIIAPAHGLVFRNNPGRIIDYYLRIGKAEPLDNKVVVIYGSMYGFVEKAIEYAIEVLRKNGIKPVVFKFTDREQASISDIVSEVIDSKAIIFGAGTYEAGVFPTIRYVAEVIKHKVGGGKQVLIISSYGWGGVAGKKLQDILAPEFNIVDVIEFRGMPSKDYLERVKKALDRLIG